MRRQQREAFAPYQNLFEIGRGFGEIGPENTFERFLPSGLPGRPDPAHYRGQLERVSNLLGGGEPASAITADFLEKLQGDPGRQAGYIYEGLEPNVPFEFRQGVKRIGAERFGRESDLNFIQRGLGGAGGNPFGAYMTGGTSFTGPSADQYRQSVNQAADLLSGSETGLTDISSSFREQLGEDPGRQYSLSVEAARRGIPWELRDTWEDLAGRSFNRWQSQAPAGSQWLPYIRGRGYQFAGA